MIVAFKTPVVCSCGEVFDGSIVKHAAGLYWFNCHRCDSTLTACDTNTLKTVVPSLHCLNFTYTTNSAS